MSAVLVSDLLGKTIIKIENDGNQLNFFTSDGYIYEMYHDQDCCESVRIDDICGDFEDLVGSPITLAEESVSSENPEGVKMSGQDDSFTWTFYRFATIKGYVNIRWYGESNGYYSESVDIYKKEDPWKMRDAKIENILT